MLLDQMLLEFDDLDYVTREAHIEHLVNLGFSREEALVYLSEQLYYPSGDMV